MGFLVLPREHCVAGEELLGFGDGFVEIEAARRVGVAVGVANDEARREGVSDWKQKRLIEARADAIISDHRNAQGGLWSGCWRGRGDADGK